MISGRGRSSSRQPATTAGYIAMVHALALILYVSWSFGGMEDHARFVTGCLALAAPFITIFAWSRAPGRLRHNFAWIAAPLAGIALLVLASAANPNMRQVFAGGQPVGFIPRDDYVRWLPSTIWPRLTVDDFLLNAGLVLAGLNLFLARPNRTQQLVTLAVIAANTGVLACVGSFLKLLRTDAILGRYPSPNPNFFATFVYYNHWGAFALLGASAAAGLAIHFRHKFHHGTWLDTPAPLLGVITLLILLSLSLSGARASILSGLVLVLAITPRIVPRRRHSGFRSSAVVSVLAIVAALAAGTYWLGRSRMKSAAEKTASQFEQLRSGGIGDARLPVYRVTWNLFLERPVFGWGWQSFRYAFRRVQPYAFKMQNEQRVDSVLLEAHNDWLQRLAELGIVGALLSLATLFGVVRIAPWRCWRVPPTFELVAGLVSLGLLAFVDFPFACPAVVVTSWTLLAIGAGIAGDRAAPDPVA